MLTPTHMIAGALVVKATSRWWSRFDLSNIQRLGIYLFGIACANLPDMSYVWIWDMSTHHRDIFHYPFFWVCVCLILAVISLVKKSRLTQVLVGLMSLQVFGHLFMDLFAVRIGLHLLWPFSSQEYSLTTLTPGINTAEWISHYIHSLVFKLEILIWLSGAYVYYIERRRRLALARVDDRPGMDPSKSGLDR